MGHQFFESDAMPSSLRILRLQEVVEKTGLSRSTIYERMNPESKRFDKTFPLPIKLGSDISRSVGWIESSVDLWIMQRSSQ